MKYLIRDFIIGMKNLYKYAPIIWNTRPWDYKYILDMMKFQIQILHDYIKDRELECDETRIPKELDMKKVIDIIGQYEETTFDDNKWNELWSIIRKGKKSDHGMQGWWD